MDEDVYWIRGRGNSKIQKQTKQKQNKSQKQILQGYLWFWPQIAMQSKNNKIKNQDLKPQAYNAIANLNSYIFD